MEKRRSVAAIFLCVFLLHHGISFHDAEPDDTISDTSGGESDRIALLAIKSKLKYIPLGIMSSWNSSLHFCDWEGITCGRKHKRVTVLNLRSYGIVGALSPYIGNLSFMREILLSNNTLQGTIPPEIGRLRRLEHLTLTNNSLGGEIPTSLFQCSNLVNLYMGYNMLVGRIPEELGSLSKLEKLWIHRNHFTGEIPKSFGNLTSLTSVYLGGNQLGGDIPDVFHRMQNLTVFSLFNNSFTGTIPSSLYNMSLLTRFSVGSNQLRGTLPQNLGLIFPQLVFFQIWGNDFSGTIPPTLLNASNLEQIEMSLNSFAGELSLDFSRMDRLFFFSVFSNSLGTGGANDLKFVSSLLNCTNLAWVQIGGNKFGGELPQYVANISSTQITFFSISNNHVSGSIPAWIGVLTKLTMLTMTGNQFSGSIPDNIGNLKTLSLMELSNNKLSGNIPTSLGNATSLLELYLDGNALDGAIPASIGNCQQLSTLDLSQNRLTGEIPKQLFSIPGLTISLRLSHNRFSGRLPEEVGNLNQLGILDVSENELSDDLPNRLGDCSSLEVLEMQGNLFRGYIPPTLRSLKGIVKIDLSRNKLSGEIPDYFAELPLQDLNLSFNDFGGEVPIKGVFTKNATVLSLLGNKRLCGGIPRLQFPKCPVKVAKKKRKMSLLAIILITVACLLLVVAFLAAFMFFRLKKKRNKNPSESIETLTNVSYGMLLKATDGFSPTNLIDVGGFGSVYKGVIEPDDHIVAIKVLHLQRRGASKSFIAECEALRSIRHRNLLKIITSCSSIDFQGNDFKALIYEFMPNGSLDKWLHNNPGSDINENQLRNLNLHQILEIVIDIATALDYLHNQCQPAVIHCDLKPSNILLDGDMLAHVGDFGLSKFLQEFHTPNQSSSIGVRGTIGYAAPEYGVGSMVSTSGDVYSFGIVLLEILTGKKPTSSVFEDGQNLHTFAQMALPDQVLKIVDPSLLVDSNDAECIISVMKIGVACSMESPHDRIEIARVVRELHLIRTNH